MGDRRRTLNPEALFDCEIPLPPLPEQRRIVAKMAQLAAKIEKAHTLRQEAVEEADAFVIAVHISFAGKRSRKLGDILELREDKVPVSPNQDYPQVGVKGFGGGLFPKPAVNGNETTYRTFNRLFDGALVLSQVKGWEGAVAVVTVAFPGSLSRQSTGPLAAFQQRLYPIISGCWSEQSGFGASSMLLREG
jgi:type I restriction enzyme S subunit